MSAESMHPYHVVIVGSGLDAAVTAAVLSNALDKTAVKITVVETDDEQDADNCVAMSPSIHAFNKILGIQESDLINLTDASFTLANSYQVAARAPYFLPYGEHGFSLRGMSFFSYAAYLHKLGKLFEYDQYSLGSVAAALENFRHPAEDTKSLYSTLVYGLNLSGPLFRQYLKKYSQDKHVEYVSANINEYILSATNGCIEALDVTIANGASFQTQQVTLTCDLIVDCSGKKAAILNGVFGVDWNGSGQTLPVDRRIDCIENVSALRPFNQHAFLSSGVSNFVSSQHKNYRSYTYNSHFLKDDAALAELFSHYELSADSFDGTILVSDMDAGRRATFWHKNCVAIGASAGDLTSTYINQMHLAQSAALRLATLFPASRDFACLATEYNRLTHLEYDHIEDFHSLHFHLPNMSVSEFWLAQSNVNVSSRLQHRIDLFAAAGRIPFYEGETISETTWIAFMVGLIGWPDDFSFLVENQDVNWVQDQLSKMQQLIQKAAHAMPSHRQYLNDYLAKNNQFSAVVR